MLCASYLKYLLNFRKPAGTSRGVLHHKETWFVKVWDSDNPSVFGLGECAVFRGLSSDDSPLYEETLKNICKNIQNLSPDNDLIDWPSIRFGIGSALLDLENGGKRLLFPSAFTEGTQGIPINGLIWMGTHDYVKQQVKEKLNAGFRCLKFKVGSHTDEDFDLLHALRQEYSSDDLEIRLDANGAFAFSEVNEILEKFSTFYIHSIEQPIKAGQPSMMAEVCRTSPIPVALDEELIGINTLPEKRNLLELVKPQYIILKPALTGGFAGTKEWIGEAKLSNTGWWVTSALESNIGLNSIAQFTYSLDINIPQGLGTGALFTNNIPSPLFIDHNQLFINVIASWDITNINDQHRTE